MAMTISSDVVDREVAQAQDSVQRVLEMMGRRLVGQQHVARRLVMAMLAEGHVLLEGMPGLAKTTAVKALGEAADLRVSRLQFTPDMLPADVVGTEIYDPKKGEFRVKRGPVFANLVIADEINRAPAKVQSALLEAMQERQVTIGDETFRLERPFLVMATQNPIEQEGTYPLPEAQMDRFLFKVIVSYGTVEDEEEVVARMARGDEAPLEKVIDRDRILQLQGLVQKIHVAEKVRRYLVQVVFATRQPTEYGFKDIAQHIAYGASPRASIALERAARVNAILEGRSFVTPQDVKDVGADILRHRLLLSYEAEADGVTSEAIVRKVFDRIDVP